MGVISVNNKAKTIPDTPFITAVIGAPSKPVIHPVLTLPNVWAEIARTRTPMIRPRYSGKAALNITVTIRAIEAENAIPDNNRIANEVEKSRDIAKTIIVACHTSTEVINNSPVLFKSLIDANHNEPNNPPSPKAAVRTPSPAAPVPRTSLAKTGSKVK